MVNDASTDRDRMPLSLRGAQTVLDGGDRSRRSSKATMTDFSLLWVCAYHRAVDMAMPLTSQPLLGARPEQALVYAKRLIEYANEASDDS